MCVCVCARAPLSLYLILTFRTYLQYKAKPSKLVAIVVNLDSLVISSAIYTDLPCPARMLYALSAEIAVEFIFQVPLSPSPFRAGCNSDFSRKFPSISLTLIPQYSFVSRLLEFGSGQHISRVLYTDSSILHSLAPGDLLPHDIL